MDIIEFFVLLEGNIQKTSNINLALGDQNLPLPIVW